jgi:hypothetical protein
MATLGVPTASIAHFVSVEMIKGLLATFRMWTSVAMLRIEAVVNVTVEVVRTVEPRAGSDEHAAAEPLARSTRTGRSCMAHSRSSHKGTPVRGRC